MNNENVKYETGATSHAVNDLILFTDTTRELAELRDNCYLSTDGESAWDFSELLDSAIKQYIKQFPLEEDHKHIKQMTDLEKLEYVLLYANDIDNWKSEHGYK